MYKCEMYMHCVHNKWVINNSLLYCILYFCNVLSNFKLHKLWIVDNKKPIIHDCNGK